jgi:hypothetical protein
VFGVTALPSGAWIREQAGRVPPETFDGFFNPALKIAEEAGLLDAYRVLGGGTLTALDGAWYHAPKTVRCDRCLHTAKGGATAYYYSASTGTIVRPGSTSVLPVTTGMIGSGDGEKKQDCELTAGKEAWGSVPAAETGALGGRCEIMRWLELF